MADVKGYRVFAVVGGERKEVTGRILKRFSTAYKRAQLIRNVSRECAGPARSEIVRVMDDGSTDLYCVFDNL